MRGVQKAVRATLKPQGAHGGALGHPPVCLRHLRPALSVAVGCDAAQATAQWRLQLRILQQKIFSEGKTGAAPTHPHGRKTFRLSEMLKGLFRQAQPSVAHAVPHGRTALLVQRLPQSFQGQVPPHRPQPGAHD